MSNEEDAVVVDQMLADALSDHATMQQVIADLAVILGDNTVEGSIRKWRADTTNTYSVNSQRALADILLNTTRAQRRIARTLYRISKLHMSDYNSADVGTDI